MRKILVVSILLLPVFFCFSVASAQRGCCSWHKGVCGCDSSGRKICCDGTLSPSCTCYVPDYDDDIDDTDFDYDYDIIPSPAPVRVVPDFPDENISLRISTIENPDKTYHILADWDDVGGVQERDYSIGIKASAGDPGPLPDTTKSEYTFENVKPGKYTISLKTKVGGVWSEYVYWENIEIPGDYKTEVAPTIESLQAEIVERDEKIEKRDKRISDLKDEIFNLKAYLFSGVLGWIASIPAAVLITRRFSKDSGDY